MKLSSETIEQIKENRALIESRDWKKVWEVLNNPELNEAFIELGYNPFEGLSKIPDEYFTGTGITKIVIPEGITSIGDWAFAYCASLTSIEIPDSVTSIESSAFEDCTSLTNIEIPDSVTNIGEYAFSGCNSLTSITIPNSVTSIGSWAFSDCSSLISVVIGNSVTSIGNSAFSGCNLLSNLVYKGGINEFKAIEKLRGWNYGVPATKVICDDGVVSLV